MIVFENDGLIDLKAVTTFGVSVKENDNPIGFFGTGLKYALAVLLREGQTVTIYRGKSKFEFRTFDDTFRGEEFGFVQMRCPNGKVHELGFTTELGKTWELWCAYRELWCNTMDEDGVVSNEDVAPQPVEGRTQIVVEGAEFENVHYGKEVFILQTKPMVDGMFAEAHSGAGQALYYKGIAVQSLDKFPARFNYNIKRDVELTEDRTLKYDWRGKHMVMSTILASDDEDFIREVVNCGEGWWEHQLDYHGTSMDPGETFLAVVGKIREETMDSNPTLNVSALLVHKEHTMKNLLPEHSIKLSPVQETQFKRAKLFVTDVLRCDLNRYPIVLLDTLGAGHLGRAANGKIYVAMKAFDMGTKWVAAALYEEFIHLSEGVRDNTHEQKMVYLEKILTLGEEVHGRPL